MQLNPKQIYLSLTLGYEDVGIVRFPPLTETLSNFNKIIVNTVVKKKYYSSLEGGHWSLLEAPGRCYRTLFTIINL